MKRMSRTARKCHDLRAEQPVANEITLDPSRGLHHTPFRVLEMAILGPLDATPAANSDLCLARSRRNEILRLPIQFDRP